MLSTKLKEAAGNSADATLYVDDVFSTYLYTGNNTNPRTIINGIDLAGKGGLVWTKQRVSTNEPHILVDTVRGSGKNLSTNNTNAQEVTGSLTAFTSSGYTISNQTVVNGLDSYTYASWTFRKAAKFFDVVTWTGDGTTNKVIPHSLGSVPGFILVKATSAANGWNGYHRSLGATQSITINSTNAAYTSATAWNNTEPTSTQFTVGNNTNCNSSGVTYVAYLFAHDTSSTGIIQCGSYTGNGSATGPTVSLGWEPQYLMIKNASGTGNWQVIDSMRGMPVGSADATLQPNLANAESSVEYLSPTATGFQITSTSTEVNTNGSTYIYMAIRRPNKPPISGTQVFSPVYEGSTTPAVQTPFVVDMGISKRKDLTSDVLMGSRLQGSRKMWTNLTNAESADANYTWDYQNGYKTNTGVSTGYDINWSFKRAPGFFDEVCYTGTGVTRTVAHNLTVAPELMIVKARTDITQWEVYNNFLGNTKSLYLNLTDSQSGTSSWNNTTPTSTTFTVTNAANVNASTITYVAYLFATLAGISKVGSYTGNGTGQAIACGFSAGARFVLIKRTDSTGGWYTFDSARGLTSGSSPYLLLNSTAAEVTGNNGVYASTGGFTLGSTASTTTNINAATYIFLAVA